MLCDVQVSLPGGTGALVLGWLPECSPEGFGCCMVQSGCWRRSCSAVSRTMTSPRGLEAV